MAAQYQLVTLDSLGYDRYVSPEIKESVLQLYCLGHLGATKANRISQITL